MRLVYRLLVLVSRQEEERRRRGGVAQFASCLALDLVLCQLVSEGQELVKVDVARLVVVILTHVVAELTAFDLVADHVQERAQLGGRDCAVAILVKTVEDISEIFKLAFAPLRLVVR